MGKADLHSHTCHDAWGDGNQTVETLLRYVEENTDLDLFAITDHDSTDAARAAWRLHRKGGYRFGFIPGVEVTNQSGHLLCYFPAGNIVDVPSLRPFWSTVRFVHERGGICIAAHPVYPPWLAPSIARTLKRGGNLDAVEVLNAGISAGAQERLDGLAAQFAASVALVGNSDAHDQDAIGSAFTRYPGAGCRRLYACLGDQDDRTRFCGPLPDAAGGPCFHHAPFDDASRMGAKRMARGPRWRRTRRRLGDHHV